MARLKPVDMSPRFLPVVLEQQIVPGTFEHALHVLIDTAILPRSEVQQRRNRRARLRARSTAKDCPAGLFARYRQQPRHRARLPRERPVFQPSDFHYDAAMHTCTCPAGKTLYSNGNNCTVNGRRYRKFTGAKRDCVPCDLRQQCLRTADKSEVRQVAIFHKNQVSPLRHTEVMKQRLDSPKGRALYGRRIATVEPVFGNLRYNKGLDRFTLRGQKKVDTQWKRYCLVHNIEKLAHHG